ncbi:GGDEF domain-containing protein [Telmatospirillum sp.]|uniref:GGDEF domain-containing protein n=1 Tax=Telmatospirillum sp. TaxID=2079197 RepID=UPI002844DADE|nr:GGDEF domain-containing protein [Telmatospirillum sp.]MDR3441208.1 GGDEF domain-containing protein [Telmatospirillum sp.]
MDPRLADLLAIWRAAFFPAETIDQPLQPFSDHADHLLIIDIDGSQSRYTHYGQAFITHFGTDLTGQIIDLLPSDILPAERRGMLAFEYTYARRVLRPLWRSYTGRFDDGKTETWQRLVLPAGQGRLVVGAYPTDGPYPSPDEGADSEGLALLRLLIERVPVVVDADGNIGDLALSLKIFSDTQQHMAELKEWATRDTLTGVANLRHFHHLAGLELDHAYRMGRAISVLALDIDYFKGINDRWGHPVGDQALKAFTAACRKALREPDILGRIGGEEFAVALPNTRIEEAQMIAERLRRQVEQVSLPLAQGDDAVSFTVSIGVVSSPPPGHAGEARPDISKLLALADAALYRSKSEGRNRVTVARPVW